MEGSRETDQSFAGALNLIKRKMNDEVVKCNQNCFLSYHETPYMIR